MNNSRGCSVHTASWLKNDNESRKECARGSSESNTKVSSIGSHWGEEAHGCYRIPPDRSKWLLHAPQRRPETAASLKACTHQVDGLLSGASGNVSHPHLFGVYCTKHCANLSKGIFLPFPSRAASKHCQMSGSVGDTKPTNKTKAAC